MNFLSVQPGFRLCVYGAKHGFLLQNHQEFHNSTVRILFVAYFYGIICGKTGIIKPKRGEQRLITKPPGIRRKVAWTLGFCYFYSSPIFDGILCGKNT